MTATTSNLSELYLEDETAWLDIMAELIEAGAYAELDYAHLREYLTDMAKRDRREVQSRLVVLLIHILKWGAQPQGRCGSWRGSILEQRYELARLAGQGVLKNHAEAVLQDVYGEAVARAAAETGLPENAFPKDCELTFDELLQFDPQSDE